MPYTGRDENKISFFKRVRQILDHHGHISLEEEIELIIIVVVLPDRFKMQVTVIEDLKIL